MEEARRYITMYFFSSILNVVSMKVEIFVSVAYNCICSNQSRNMVGVLPLPSLAKNF